MTRRSRLAARRSGRRVRSSAGEQMTIVTGLRKGVVSEPKPLLVDAAARRRAHVRSVADADGLDARRRRSRWSRASARCGGARDAIAGSSRSTTRRRTIPTSACRSSPPSRSRSSSSRPRRSGPAQMGLLLDERADTLDVTATIIDLAVRGYLTITEIPKTGWFGSTDWEIERKKPADGQLLDYERIVLDGLFSGGGDATAVGAQEQVLQRSREGQERALRRRGRPQLVSAKSELDSRDRSRARHLPDHHRRVHGDRPRRAVRRRDARVADHSRRACCWRSCQARCRGARRIGRELMRRSLGFAKYMKTAETAQQAFAERANIFTSYLPYAIVFRCVDKWARAFKDIDVQAATGGLVRRHDAIQRRHVLVLARQLLLVGLEHAGLDAGRIRQQRFQRRLFGRRRGRGRRRRLVMWGLRRDRGARGDRSSAGSTTVWCSARLRTREAWSAIDVQLQRRASLIPNLVESVKGYATYERETLKSVTAARGALSAATNPRDAARANDDLSGALRSFFAVAEAYPDLKANERFAQLQIGSGRHREQDRVRAQLLQRRGRAVQHQGPECSRRVPRRAVRLRAGGVLHGRAAGGNRSRQHLSEVMAKASGTFDVKLTGASIRRRPQRDARPPVDRQAVSAARSTRRARG